MDAEEMTKLNAIHRQAWEVRNSIMPKVPNPRSMMDHYVPMHFDRLTNGSKKFVIEPWKSTRFPVTNMRHAIMLGVKSLTVDYGREMEFHKLLKIDGDGKGRSVMTSDAPVEIYTQYLAFSKAKGNVLVGGLGLGMAATMMLNMPGVKNVTVVEKEKAIISLVGPQLDKRINIIHADLYQYLRQLPGCNPYEFAYYDIWYGTGESTWAEHVVPLYRLTRKAGIKKIGAWGEHEMRWQLAEGLYVRTCVGEEYSPWKPYAVFIEGVKKVLGGAPPYGPEHKDRIVELIRLYLERIGTLAWEKTFDWDGYRKEGR